jgi:hypothetical protein
MFSFWAYNGEKNGSIDCASTIYRLQENLKLRREVFYGIFIEFSIPMKLVWLIKYILSEMVMSVEVKVFLVLFQCRMV